MCGALAIRLPVGVEQRAGEIEPLLDVHRVRVFGERHAHLLGDRHEQVVEHLEQHRIGRRADRVRAARAARRASSTRSSRAVSARAPARLDHRRRVRLADDRRARRSRRPARRSLAREHRGVVAARPPCRRDCAGSVAAAPARGAERARGVGRRRRERPIASTADRLDHQRASRHQEAVLRAVAPLEVGDDGRRIAGQRDRRASCRCRRT